MMLLVGGVVTVLVLLGRAPSPVAAPPPPSAPSNLALSDPVATEAVRAQVSEALRAVFGIHGDALDQARRDAGKYFTEAAAKQYDSLLMQVPPENQRITVTVSDAAVRTLTGSKAELLVFVEQHVEKPGTAGTTGTAALVVTAEQVGQRWLIADLRTK
ncbi:hypothetical protein FNH05_27210 [Amycolatopsis rhizosphaerae]|uniref:Mce-associated membrane protein n=1 Tax=Amycolatopsis rhizosphaerae TaxID=2053003 RepID=A0A558B9X5_9PSEU|nr:hypothetical protein [Amycolatopsis rhizosphaerae]TVT33311.1 hypothetical protein FNH05_27210 [Amycolatopsis rhizosphaerae]